MTITVWDHLKFLKQLLLHKWYVFVAACRLGIPWRGLLHDLSKFSKEEWLPRVKFMKTGGGIYKDERGNYCPDKVPSDLALCWMHHYRKNPHHWQWWVLNIEDGAVKVLPMAEEYRLEMIADWLAVEKTYGRQEARSWYWDNRHKMIFHPETRKLIEEYFGISD